MTKPFKHILLVVGDKHDDRAAIECALEFASLNNASLKVVKVVDNLSKFIEIAKPILHHIVNVKKLLTLDLENRIKHKIKPSNQLSVTYKILEGLTFIEIIKEVIRYKHDMLVISSEMEKKIDVGLFNSTNFHLFRKCPCPVWVVKPVKTVKSKKILVAVDIDPNDDVKIKLNDKLMNIALILAQEYQSELHVFYAWQLYGEDILRNSPFLKVDKRDIDEKVKEEKNINIERMNVFIDKFKDRGVVIHRELHKGSPVELIPDFIKKNRMNLVVMGTVCRIGIPGFIMGNTAEEILRKINCSVITIKPDGFVSPVQ